MKWSDLKDTPVVSVADAARLGFVDDAYLDAAGRQVLGFAVRRGGLVTHRSAMRYSDVQAIGEDAVTVRDAAVLNDPGRFSQLDTGVTAEKVRGLEVVTEGGSKVGSVGDLAFDDNVSSVTSLILSENLLDRLRGQEHTIPATAIQSVSDQLLVVDNGVATEAG